MSDSPPLSVVVSTTDPWPKLEPFLARAEPQLASLAGELVVCDGSRGGLPPSGLPSVRCVAVESPGASVFELRALGIHAATGDVIAITEDHCLPEAGWCRDHLASHAASPEVDVVGGAVLNGSTATLMDWANFLMTFAPFLPPLTNAGGRVPPIANLSMKRRALAESRLRPGALEFDLLPRLLGEGKVAVDDRPRVVHVQSHGLLRTPVVHFHNGRSTMGLPGHRLPAPTLVQELVRHAWHPFLLWRETASAVRARCELPRRAKLSLPAAFGLAVCHSAGEVVGLLAGPGCSPERLE